MIQILTVLTIALLVGADQLIKYFIVTDLRPIGQKVLIPDVLQLRYVENDGAMMGFLQGRTILMSVAAGLVLIVLLWVIFSGKVKSRIGRICLIMIAAGGMGNIIDRIFRGFVVDYIEALFVDFYVFNFADCLVTVAAFMLIIYQIYDIIKETKSKRGQTDD